MGCVNTKAKPATEEEEVVDTEREDAKKAVFFDSDRDGMPMVDLPPEYARASTPGIHRVIGVQLSSCLGWWVLERSNGKMSIITTSGMVSNPFE
jgi:hypothetical protein